MIAINYEIKSKVSNTNLETISHLCKENTTSPLHEIQSGEPFYFLNPLIKTSKSTKDSNYNRYLKALLSGVGSNNRCKINFEMEPALSIPQEFNDYFFVTANSEYSSVSSISSEINKVNANINKTLESIVFLEKNHNERLASRYLMKGIEKSFRSKDINFINDLLLSLNTDLISIRSKAIALRTAFRAKRRLPAWNKAYEDLSDELRNKNIDPEEWLIGLR